MSGSGQQEIQDIGIHACIVYSTGRLGGRLIRHHMPHTILLCSYYSAHTTLPILLYNMLFYFLCIWSGIQDFFWWVFFPHPVKRKLIFDSIGRRSPRLAGQSILSCAVQAKHVFYRWVWNPLSLYGELGTCARTSYSRERLANTVCNEMMAANITME
jgi:hypothetical protein